ncbi:hypothetical protein SNEBB_000549 [Seison nebaliae]|nr:hypothetical protein SNEBB_000549 [Seison nebaliae]
MTTIECRAAVSWKAGESLRIENVKVAPPRQDEVRVRIVSSGVCHTDAYTLSGKDPEGVFPVILGHEGSGIIESLGEGSEDEFAVGDHVVLLYIPQCRTCEYCKRNDTNLCQRIRMTQGRGLMPDGTSRFKIGDQTIFHYMGTSSFSQYSVVSKYSLCKINKKANLYSVCLLGCGISTGYGTALNIANVTTDSTCAVWGLGAVGLAVIMGCKERKAKQIIGIDINEEKFPDAEKFGATLLLNPKKFGETETSFKEHLLQITNGGLDFTFECVGNVKLMREALECAHKGWGVSTIVGVAGAGEEISTRPFQLVTGRSWKGSAFGGWKSKDSVPKLVDLYMEEKLKVDEFISAKMKLDDINSAFTLMKMGKFIRPLIILETTQLE